MNETYLNEQKFIEALTLSDEYLFEEVLRRNIDITKSLLERIIGITEISEIEYVDTEVVQTSSKKYKGVRFDVYIKDQDGVAYIVELQRADTKELPERARYYQVTADSRQLPKGSNYKDLRDNYVIFICREDIFGYGLYKYTFENLCHEIPGLKLDDGTHKIFLNTQGNNGDAPQDVVDFLKLIEGKRKDTPFIQKIENAAQEIKKNEIWRERRMQSLVREQDERERFEKSMKEAVEQGLAQGLQKGIEQGIEQERLKIIKLGIVNGVDISTLSLMTGLLFEDIEKIKQDTKTE